MNIPFIQGFVSAFFQSRRHSPSSSQQAKRPRSSNQLFSVPWPNPDQTTAKEASFADTVIQAIELSDLPEPRIGMRTKTRWTDIAVACEEVPLGSGRWRPAWAEPVIDYSVLND